MRLIIALPPGAVSLTVDVQLGTPEAEAKRLLDDLEVAVRLALPEVRLTRQIETWLYMSGGDQLVTLAERVRRWLEARGCEVEMRRG